MLKLSLSPPPLLLSLMEIHSLLQSISVPDYCPVENSSMATGSRQWAAAGLIGIMMCAVAVLQMWGSDTRSAMSNTGVKEGVLPSAAAEDSLSWRTAQRGQGMVSSWAGCARAMYEGVGGWEDEEYCSTC